MAEQSKTTTPASRNSSEGITFTAEIKQVTSKKTASLDVEYRVVFASDDPTVNTLGLVDGDTMVQVSVRLV